MSPSVRARVIDAMIEVMPSQVFHDCAICDPSGGCATPHLCAEEVCEKLLDVIEREGRVKL